MSAEISDRDIEREGICPDCGGLLGTGLAIMRDPRPGHRTYSLHLCAKCHDCGHTPGASGFLFMNRRALLWTDPGLTALRRRIKERRGMPARK